MLLQRLKLRQHAFLKRRIWLSFIATTFRALREVTEPHFSLFFAEKSSDTAGRLSLSDAVPLETFDYHHVSFLINKWWSLKRLRDHLSCMLLLNQDLRPLFLSLLLIMVGVSFSLHTWGTRIIPLLHRVVRSGLHILRFPHPLLTSEGWNLLDRMGEGLDG